jgi:predicted homoserine dehydrogenase-like protein
MAVGNTFARDVAAGTIITAEMISHPADSFLWQLRGQQDEHFLAS